MPSPPLKQEAAEEEDAQDDDQRDDDDLDEGHSPFLSVEAPRLPFVNGILRALRMACQR
jgi:hypothetical protein